MIGVEKYDKWNYWLNIGISLDKLGNSVSGGDNKNTISARTGDYANRRGFYSLFWAVLEWIINITFRAVDGPNHCYNAYLKEQHDNTFRDGNWGGRLVLMPIVIMSCLVIAPVLWTLKPFVTLIKKIGFLA